MAFAKLTDAHNSKVCMFGFDSYVLILQMLPPHKYYGIRVHSYLCSAKKNTIEGYTFKNKGALLAFMVP